jgi:hypothetical protein
MSTIQVFAKAAGQAGRVLRSETFQPSVTPSTDPIQHRDQDMMYAWSIGVTDATRVVEPEAREHEECPPEVYIG